MRFAAQAGAGGEGMAAAMGLAAGAALLGLVATVVLAAFSSDPEVDEPGAAGDVRDPAPVAVADGVDP